jgi:hypothetical protein
LGAIVGGTIAACLFVSFILLVIFLAWRRRKVEAKNNPHSAGAFHQRNSQTTMVEYNPFGFPSPGFSSEGASSPRSPYGEDNKAWQQLSPGTRRGQVEIVEVDGTSRAVEAPTAEK